MYWVSIVAGVLGVSLVAGVLGVSLVAGVSGHFLVDGLSRSEKCFWRGSALPNLHCTTEFFGSHAS